jgi:hypothetical protein
MKGKVFRDRDYFPLSPGLRRRYQVNDGIEEDPYLIPKVTFAVLRVEGVWPEIRAEIARTEGDDESGKVHKYAITCTEAGVFANDKLILPFPIEEGRQWEGSHGTYTVQTKDRTEAVPAGVFENCLRVTYPIHGGDSGWGEQIYAPGVGLIRETYSDEASPWTLELLSYESRTQFYSCFISYSTADEEFAKQLYDDLQANGVPCWFAPHDIQGGKKLYEQIDQAIKGQERVLLILSQASMNSAWVKTEIAKARDREADEGRRVLFPVRIVPYEALRDWQLFDADRGTDSAKEIREYFIPDFSRWMDHKSYEEQFSRLLTALKADKRDSAVKVVQ